MVGTLIFIHSLKKYIYINNGFVLAGFNCWSTLRCGKCSEADKGDNIFIFA